MIPFLSHNRNNPIPFPSYSQYKILETMAQPQLQFTDEVTLDLTNNFLRGDEHRFLPPVGETLSLAFLRQALRPKDTSGDFVERFLPTQIYIREEMENAFKELLNNGVDTSTVFSGSPGIGKSILMFLVVLYRVACRHEKAIFIRHTNDFTELVSIFAMEHSNDDNTVHIRFNRECSRNIDTAAANDQLRSSFEGVKWTSSSIVDAVDGPKATALTNFSKLTYGCTSGEGIRIKHHMAKTTFNVVMAAWKVDDLSKALIAELGLDPTVTDESSKQYYDEEKFDAVYFVNGGRIRGFRDSYTGTIDTSFADQTVARISRQQAELSLSHSDCRSTDDYVDSLRSMFRVPGGSTDSVSLHVDSSYMLRKLRSKLDGEELFNSYKKAERENNKGAQAGYFEEMLHWCFCRHGFSPSILASVHAEGSGIEGVRELTQKNQYWIPSVPNFVNIDSAIVGSDEKVWCYQFTVSKTHTFKKRRMRSGFLNHISVLDRTQEVVIVFVYPSETNFRVPDTGGEVESDVFAIDCLTLENVCASVQTLANKVAVN